MSLESGFKQLIHADKDYQPSDAQAISVLDLTLLDLEASPGDLASLFELASQHPIAAVCVYPQHLPNKDSQYKGKRATVINFPQGLLDWQNNLEAIAAAKTLGVEEIDYVFPYRIWLEGNQTEAILACREVIKYCKAEGLMSKIILESGAFDCLEQVYELALAVCESGCDFIKTSTGKIAQGASLKAAFAMATAIVDSGNHCGLKLSGGIKTRDQAFYLMRLFYCITGRIPGPECFRLGASSLLSALTGQE